SGRLQNVLRSGHTLTAEERGRLDDDTASAVHVDARCPRFVSKSGARTWSTRHSSSQCANWIWRNRSQAQAHTTLYVTDREQSNWQPETNLKSHRNSWFAAEHRS